MPLSEEELVAGLVLNDDYAHHIGQVVSVGTETLRVLKKQFSITTPYRIDTVPLKTCVGLRYESGSSVFHIIAGALLVVLMLAIAYFLIIYWSRLEPGTRVQVGLLTLAFAYGLRWAFMSKHHRLVFNLRDGARLHWRSRSGDFKYRERAVEKVIEYMRSIGVPVTTNEART